MLDFRSENPCVGGSIPSLATKSQYPEGVLTFFWSVEEENPFNDRARLKREEVLHTGGVMARKDISPILIILSCFM